MRPFDKERQIAMRKSVLILCPPFSDQGGVAYYYWLVKKHFYSSKIAINFFHTGKDYSNQDDNNRFFKTLYDLRYLAKIMPQYDLIVLNPSLDMKALLRDGAFHFFAKQVFRKKTLVFFHGWLPDMEKTIDRYGPKIFKYFFESDCVCVLAGQFKDSLVSWGFDPASVRVETTLYEQKKFDIPKDPLKIVFLSRFVAGKGCLEAIKTVEQLVGDYPDIKLYMAGEGEMSTMLKAYVENRNLANNVEFTGYLKGNNKYRLLEQCGFMLYPTNYGEGIPISVLEGMGMGCVVITRPMGGIPDVLTDGENGFLIDALQPQDFADKIKELIQNQETWKSISKRGTKKATEKYEIRNAVNRLEKLYFQLAK